jgi:signal transduction histidine kinase
MSKIESGMIEFEQVPFSMQSLVQSQIRVLRSSAIHKGLSLTAVIDELVPSYVMGDPTRLTQILSNLLSNAVKFTLKGSVTVYVKRLAFTASQQMGKRDSVTLEMRVHDTGIGIS